MKGKPGVLVADDHAVVAEALATSLGRWYRVVGIVTVLERVGAAIKALAPDVVLLDLMFAGKSALNVLGGLVERHSGTRFVILTAYVEPVFADMAIKAGALAYVVKESAASELRIAIEEALAGRIYITPMIRDRGAGGGTGLASPEGFQLSDRQRDILGLLRQGRTYRQIAESFQISTKTVEYHINMLKRRVGVGGRAQLIRWSEQFFREEGEAPGFRSGTP